MLPNAVPFNPPNVGSVGSAIVHVREPRLAERGLETEDDYEQRHVAPKGALAEPWRRIGPLTADGAGCFGRRRGPDNRDPRRRGRPRDWDPGNATPRAPARHAPSAACKAARDRARSTRACGSSACGSAAVTTGASRPRMSAGTAPALLGEQRTGAYHSRASRLACATGHTKRSSMRSSLALHRREYRRRWRICCAAVATTD